MPGWSNNHCKVKRTWIESQQALACCAPAGFARPLASGRARCKTLARFVNLGYANALHLLTNKPGRSNRSNKKRPPCRRPFFV